MRLRFLLILLVAFVFPSLGRAQSVHWDPPSGALAVGQARALALVFEDCAPKGQPTPPKVSGLTLQFYGQSSSTSIVNFTASQSTTLTYAALLGKNERIEIPAFDVETDKGRMRVAAARYEPTGATVGNSGTPLESAASARLAANPNSVWTGEVIDLTATILAARRYAPQIPPSFEWNADQLAAENWSKPEPVESTVNGEPHVGYSYSSRALARTPGTLKLNPATHIVSLSVGVSGFGFFQQRQYDQYSVASNTPSIEVKALPPKPAGFTGAVGQFKLTSKLVPASAAVGEPLTWTLELSGTGNWPDISGLPSRDVSKDFNVVQPQAKRTPAEGKLFDATLAEDVVLVPTKPGTYTLGPINFVYFDPKSGAYKTISTPRHTVTVTAPEAPKFALTPPATDSTGTQGEAGARTGGDASLSIPPPPVVTLPSGIPRDPLPGTNRVPTPWELREVLIAALVPFGVLLLFWAGLALRRAWQTDPILPRRKAQARLAATLAKLQNASAAQRPALLLDWQRDAAALWEIPHAAPPPLAFNDPTWSALWQDTDRALYASDAALSADWTKRADAALVAKRVPRFAVWRLLLPRNFAPFLFAFAVGLLSLPLDSHAQEPAVAYRGGDFAAAEKGWRDALAKNPADATTRHNLSLALAQQDRWNEAAAHSTVAFVQDPAEPAIRWQFALTADKSGAVPEPLAVFLQPGIVRRFAGQASPAVWQRLIVGAAGGIALALGILLFNAYGRRSRPVFWIALGAFGIFSVMALVSVFGVVAYGIAADTRAVITWRTGTLRSIPTEADTAQKTTPLSAGTLAIADDKTFLGWTRLSFANGQTGWVRNEELVSVWK